MSDASYNVHRAPLQPATIELRHLSDPEKDIQIARGVIQKHAPGSKGLPLPEDIRYVHLSHKSLATANVLLRHAYMKSTKGEIRSCRANLKVAQQEFEPVQVAVTNSFNEERPLRRRLARRQMINSANPIYKREITEIEENITLIKEERTRSSNDWFPRNNRCWDLEKQLGNLNVRLHEEKRLLAAARVREWQAKGYSPSRSIIGS